MDTKFTESNAFNVSEIIGKIIVPSRLPKTIVLSISSHGTIIYGKPLFEVPSGIVLVKMNSVIPSVCNFIHETDLKEANDYITEKVESAPVFDSSNLISFCAEVRDEIILHAKSTLESVEYDVKQKLKTGEMENIELMIPFLHSVDHGYAVVNATGGSIINKRYSRKNTEAINPYGDWQIKALNVEGQPDIMIDVERDNGRRSAPGREGEAVVYLNEIINFCMKRGSTRFLIFDFSCAYVSNENIKDFFTNDRDRRMFAKDMLRTGKWGGNHKKNDKKTRKRREKTKKTRKNKKTRKKKKKQKTRKTLTRIKT
jgi:hypothetical protein